MVELRTIPEFPAYKVSMEGDIWSDHTQRYLKQFSANDYSTMSVSFTKDGKSHKRAVAALVMAAFIGPKPKNHDVRHIDDDNTNNHIANLRYVPRSETLKKAHAEGNYRPTYRILAKAKRKLTFTAAQNIRRLHKNGLSMRKLAKRFGVSSTAVFFICNGDTYRESFR